MDKLLLCRLRKGIVTVPVEIQKVEQMGAELKKAINARFRRSFNIREVDTGSCGICEAEIIAANNPVYDVARFGVNFVASPRHADALLVTGPVGKNMLLALQKTYDAMPEPKLVITLGDCALDGGIFKESYYVEGGVSKILPVTLHIPGCPPTPLEIIEALLGLLKQ
ncbi:hydrogenase [candidate division WOR-1 bacterium RIFOXYA12_FULL_43_27]|uniref:Hydrogenase n=1 Tax=candidate division WOR-1 bacterium RIFOXYC2_FULL_46_14 TaxID=1802587 RepID=A0A1F4U800_UNCSA|nr:MAG: hydrogenase [candidate division WOR-1 bacterium RIFOXYA12_FULL_43_27]OGC19610.1 MAG: hydrogenase [candidate division WOR-1 bacterium RIFOXYB2_FULL_46_45]OGC30597.1 MAG: hydrogenase [candidate division WOR-1 bacterium RIFOXYA2_FULL_46_56]OGC41076.1 MAG: hydrogenase [candidate division WOR-1 bacterium RIFOXYC2_FULL_46_14]